MIGFVTGGTGHIGSTLVKVLNDRGYEVHCLVRESSDLTYLKSLNSDKIFFKVGDITSAESLKQAMKDTQPDYVFHLAAAVSHWGS